MLSKKIVVVLLSFLMLFSMFPGTVFAQNIEEGNLEEEGLPAVEEPVEEKQTEKPVISQEIAPREVQSNEVVDFGEFWDKTNNKKFDYTEAHYLCDNIKTAKDPYNSNYWIQGLKFNYNGQIGDIVIPPYFGNGSSQYNNFYIVGPIVGGSLWSNDSGSDYSTEDRVTQIYISENFTQVSDDDARAWENPFQSCKALKRIYVDYRNPVYFSDEYGVLYRWMNPDNHDEGAALVCFPRNTQMRTDATYKIPDNVVRICENAFYNVESVEKPYMPNLIDLVIPSSVKIIDNNNFASCENLRMIVFAGDAPSFERPDMFYRYPSSVSRQGMIQVVYKYGASGFTPDNLHPEYDFESWNGAKINPNVVRVDMPSYKVANAGGYVDLKANIYPKNAYARDTDYVISWGSNDKNMATVAALGKDSNNSSTGRVSVPSGKSGKTTITAQCVHDIFYNYLGTEPVIGKCEIEIGTPITGVSLPATRDLYVGNISPLSAMFYPANATNNNVTWRSDNEEVATVSGSGSVTAKKAGEAKITVTTVDGGYEATCIVTVLNIPASGVKLNKPATSIKVGAEEKLIATVSPTDAFNKNVIWSSDDETVATVSQEGLVTAKKAGSAIITVTTEDGGYKAACSVMVSNVQVTKVILTQTEVTLKVGEQQQLTASVEPANATNKKIIYEIYGSASSDVIEISEDGLITATGVGTEYIKGKAEDGYNGTEYAICKVTVERIPVTGVSFESELVELKAGQKYQLEPIIAPANATNKGVGYHWATAGNITVSNTGLIESNGAGSAYITVYTNDGGFSAVCRVVFLPILVDEVSLNYSEETLEYGQTLKLITTVLPEDATNKKIIYMAEDVYGYSCPVNVTQDGLVTAVRAGEAIVYAVSEDSLRDSFGEDRDRKDWKAAICRITVPEIPIERISLEPTSVILKVGETCNAKVTIFPEYATNKRIVYGSDNPEVASARVTGYNAVTGIITANKVGKTTIYARTESVDGVQEEMRVVCEVTVVEDLVPVEKVTLNKTKLDIKTGEKEQLSATIVPADATDKGVTWSSNNEAIAKVDSNGWVEAVGEGSATITVTTYDGGLSAECEVTVTKAEVRVTGVTLNKTNLDIKTGEKEQLSATVAPADATNKGVTWSSSNEAIAKVDSNGWVEAVGEGSATITVTTKDQGKTASCTVTVIKTILSISVTGVSIDHTSAALTVGQTQQLSAAVTPDNATNKDLTWSSNNPSVAKVDANGVITAMGKGSAIITVTTADGGKTATCNVTVNLPIVGSYQPNKLPSSGIKGTAIEVQLMNGAVSQTMTSSNSKAIVVNGNILEFVGSGKSTVKVTYTLANGKKTTVSKTITIISKVTGIKLDRDSATISRKGKVTLKATIEPADATNKTVVWSVYPKGIATVSNKGVVTGVKGGDCVVTAKSKENGAILAQCNITVTPIYETAIKLNKPSVSLAKGKTFQLKATFVPSTTDFKTVTYTTDKPDIATVDAKGKITAKQIPGDCTITATSANGKVAYCKVTVLPQKVTSVKLSNAAATQYAGNSVGLQAIVGPANADNRAVTWSTSNSKVATVDQNGNVSFLAGGKVTIKAAAQDGSNKSASKTFTVKEYVSSINLNATEISIDKGKTYTLKATVAPATATTKTLTWTSSNTKVATVSSKGVVKGVAGGTAIITCKAKDGSGVSMQCTVNVSNPESTEGSGASILLKGSSPPPQELYGKVEMIDYYNGGRALFTSGQQGTIIDIKTGLSFNIIEQGTTNHFDSTPATKEDTAIFKQIAGGKWTWDRRPVWLKVGDRYFAASINCMPHGGNTVKGNNFGGHFCVHVGNTKLHTGNKVCPIHQACVKDAFNYGNGA